jgi:hypothetical protein
MWFRNHSRGAYVWSQADQRICSLHALCLPTGNLEGRALLHDDWLLFLHICGFGSRGVYGELTWLRGVPNVA